MPDVELCIPEWPLTRPFQSDGCDEVLTTVMGLALAYCAARRVPDAISILEAATVGLRRARGRRDLANEVRRVLLHLYRQTGRTDDALSLAPHVLPDDGEEPTS